MIEKSREDIQEEVWWSLCMDSDEVQVTIKDGKARLAGKLDSRAEYGAARDNACQGEALRVHNALEVRR